MFTFVYDYLREHETEFTNILECESEAHMGGQFMKKTRSKKSRATVPLTEIASASRKCVGRDSMRP